MSYESEIEALEGAWSEDEGFFWHLRQGYFAPVEFERTLKTISMIRCSEDALLPRRIVSLLWFIPLFMEWQVERVQENKGDAKAYSSAIATMTDEVTRILGAP